MIYSVFAPAEGMYHYYQTSETKAVNADLPIPSLGNDAGKIGVPAIDAARPLPGDAVFVGRGGNARGVIADKKSGAFSGLDSVRTMAKVWEHRKIIAAAGIAGVALLLWRSE